MALRTVKNIEDISFYTDEDGNVFSNIRLDVTNIRPTAGEYLRLYNAQFSAEGRVINVNGWTSMQLRVILKNTPQPEKTMTARVST